MKPSDRIKNYIKETETFQANEYDDRGVGSVGYGIRGSGKKSVTPEEAERDFLARLNVAEQELKANITRPGMTQDKWDALYDMHYNMGLTKMREQGFIDLINKGSDEEIANSFRNANKSRHSTTGEVEVIPSLTKRAAYRASLWLGQQDNTDVALDLGVLDEDIDLSVLDDPEGLDLSVIDEPSNPRNIEGELTTNLNSAVELPDEQEKSALKLAKEFNRPIEEMRAEIVDSSYDDVRVKYKTSDIVKGSPKTAEFAASSPERANLLKKTKDYLPKVESAAKQLNKDERNMLEKVINTNRATITKGFTYLGMVTGALSPDQAITGLQNLSKEQQDNVINTPEMQEITRVMEKMTPVMKKALGEVTNSWDSTKAPHENILPALAAVADNTPEFAEALWDITYSLIKNPATATALVAQTQLPMVAGAAAGMVGGVGAAAVTAGSLSGVMSFTEYMDRQLEAFRDPETNEINYGLAFSDPNRVAQWRNEAAIYSGVMAASDALFQKGGDFFVKHFMKTGAGAKGAAKAVAANAVTGAVTEGGSQFTALQATDIYGDKVSTERTAENLAEGITEGTIGAFAAGGTTVAKMGTLKTVEAIKKARAANEDVAAASELRTKLQEDEAYQSDAQEVDEFVDTVATPNPAETEAEISSDDLDAPAPTMEQAIEIDATNNVATLTPSEFEKFAEIKGINAAEVLGAFSPRTQAEYARSRQSDSPVAIPISEFLRATEEFPEIDGIARFNGNELNALEANETLEDIEKNPFVMFERDEDLPELPTMENETPVQEIEGVTIHEADETTVPGSDLVSRPIPLTHQFRNLQEREAYNTLRNKLSRAVFKDAVDPKALDLIADVQFRHLRQRADVLGKSVAELSDRVKYRKATAKDGVRGVFIPADLEKDFHTVAFTKNADAKTVLHELSHLWLYEMAEDAATILNIPEAQRTDQQAEYAKAMKAAAELLGLEDVNALLTLSEADQTKLQEIFANTAEKYFAEGNFENSKLRYLFESLRKWIVAAARPLKNLVRTYPTLKLDGRFEFVIDTILGATDKLEDALYPMFDGPMFTKEDLGDAEFKAYNEKLKDARSEAQAQAYGKVFTKSMRARERQLDNSLNQLYDQAVATVEEMTSQKLAEQFRKSYEGRKQGDIENRLSFESVRDVLAKGSEVDAEVIKKNVPTYVMTGKKKGGIDVSLLMQMMGVNDPAIMLDFLLEMGRKDQLIEAEFERLVKEFDHGLKSDQEIHDIAVEAVNNKGRERLILDEFNLLAAKNPQALRRLGAYIANAASSATQDLAKVLKASAENTVPFMNAFKFTPTNFMNRMMGARKQASRALRRGDIEAAIQAKHIESQQYFNFKEAQKLKPQLARSLKRISKLFNDFTSLARQPFYDRQVMEYGVRIAIAAREGNADALQPLNAEEISAISPIGEDGIKAINASFDKFKTITNGRLGENTSVAGMIALGDFVKTVMHQAREAKLTRLNGKTQEVAAVANRIKAEVGEGSSINTFNHTRNFLEGYFASTVNVRTMFESLYKSKEDFVNGVFSQLLEAVEKGETARNLDAAKYNNRVVDALRKVAKADTKLQALFAPIINKIPGKASIDKTARPISSPELDHTFNNISEVLTMLLIMGSESGARKLILGRNWGGTDVKGNLDKSKVIEFINRAVDEGIITSDHINFVNTTHEVMAEIYPMVAQAMLEVDGVVIGHIDPSPIETKAGVIKGGYFPLTRAPRIVNGRALGVRASTTDFTDLMSADTLNTDAHKLFPIQDKSLTKNRDDSIYEVDLALDKVVPYINAALNIAHLRKPLKDFGKVLNHPTTRQVLDSRRPGVIDTMINPWFTRVLRQEYTVYSDGVINGAARFIRSRATVAMYFGAVTSMSRQFFGLAPVVHELGANSWRVPIATTKFLTAPMKASVEVSKKSSYMNGRREGSQKAFIRSFDKLSSNFDWLSDSQAWSQDKAFALIQFTQNIVDTITWIAAYDSVVNKMSEDRAIAYADNMVKSTQSDPSVSEMPAILAGTDLHKLVTAVMTQTLAMHNMMRVETMRDQSTFMKARLATTFSLVALGLVGFTDALLSELAFPIPEEEEERDPEKAEQERAKRIMARSFGAVVDTGFPVFGRGVVGLLSNDTVTISPTVARATRAVEGVAKSSNAARKDQDLTPYEFSGLMDFFTFVSGLPFSKLGDLNKLNYDNLEPWERRALKKERALKNKIYQRESR